jgi:hypothetical protein
LAVESPERTAEGLALLDAWRTEQLDRSGHGDPLDNVVAEGGPFHVRGELPAYLSRLRETGRSDRAEQLIERHPKAAGGH